MYQRKLSTSKNTSFFLFGARGTGKSTFLKHEFDSPTTMWIDLLKNSEEEAFLFDPDTLTKRLDALDTTPEWVVIDEIQKVPKLLDIVHYEIENRGIKFALAGSSARKIRRGGANLLAGRALMNNLFPLTHQELATDFSLDAAIHWGTLPGLYHLTDKQEKIDYLNTYVNSYLKEEIFQEQLVRKVTPFRKFFRIAAQSSGKIVNFNNIAADVGVDWATVRTYFEILEDTLLTFTLPAFHRSLRKQQLKSPKIYLFDIGVKRALDKQLTTQVIDGREFGLLFEHLIILEIHRLNKYLKKDYELSYLMTQGGAEIDLVIERPGQKTALVEIKSARKVTATKTKHLHSFMKDYPGEFEAFCLCREEHPKMDNGIAIVPWQTGIKRLGLE